MPRTDPNLGLAYGWTLGESGWADGMDANLKRLGAVVGLAVKGRNLNSPPANAAPGDRYIVPAGAAGDWAGQSHCIALFVDGWEYHPPRIGWLCYVEDEARLVVFQGAGWSAGIAL